MPNNFTFILAENPPEKREDIVNYLKYALRVSRINYILVIFFYFSALKQECCNSNPKTMDTIIPTQYIGKLTHPNQPLKARSPEKEKFVAATPPIPRTNPAAAPETIIVPSNHLLLKMIP